MLNNGLIGNTLHKIIKNTTEKRASGFMFLIKDQLLKSKLS